MDNRERETHTLLSETDRQAETDRDREWDRETETHTDNKYKDRPEG